MDTSEFKIAAWNSNVVFSKLVRIKNKDEELK
jgi:hypothetical protein